MKKSIEKLIPRALQAVEEHLAHGGTVPSAYNGYIASMGASIVQMGLLPTLAFYSLGKSEDAPGTDNEKGADTKEDRSKLLLTIFKIIEPEESANYQGTLLKYALEENVNQRFLKKRILNAAIAVKLAIRTFKLEDSNN